MNRTKDRLDFRLDRSIKLRIERAATVTGQSVSSFAVAALVREANSILAESEAITLNAEASRVFLDRLDKDIKPNARLKRAAKRHAELIA
jgi:uncharacterized protein (DUF1778 family)